MPTERKSSFFSKKGICTVIRETFQYMKENESEEFDLEDIASHLESVGAINDSIADILLGDNKDLGDCQAMIKTGRCSNPITKINHKFCTLHTNNPPDMTWDDFQRAEAIKISRTPVKTQKKSFSFKQIDRRKVAAGGC